VPTAKEEGVNVVDYYWRTVLALKRTPRPIINKLAAVFKKVTEDKAFIGMLRKFGEEPDYLGPEGTREAIQEIADAAWGNRRTSLEV
jgi:tripartite-type tricarboxylate transporter receptor subunit TctC